MRNGPNQRYKTKQTELPASVGRTCGKSPLDPMSRCRCIVAWCDAGVAVAGDGSAASPRCLLAATLRRYPPVPLGTIPLQSVFHLATAIGMVSCSHAAAFAISAFLCVCRSAGLAAITLLLLPSLVMMSRRRRRCHGAKCVASVGWGCYSRIDLQEAEFPLA